ncbi:metallo-dependent phosphatase [Fusarium beomiforme]|uniref:Metallo-dependent phosphatase n=1 Tax=Fusarium beomiforme TaxID=44412 RepID=A0A9P5AD50_9HYPO|nr:metallo-dependent phosphatase [Fusarium beomiforme]
MQIWYRIEKELILDESPRSPWLYVALKGQDMLTAEELVVIDIRVNDAPPSPSSGGSWERRPGGIWVLRGQFPGAIEKVVTQVDVLFGKDAVDPRPHWVLMLSSLKLNGKPEISDMHMVTGVGVCKDAIDAHGKDLPVSEADPLTIEFIGRILDVEEPDLMVLTGDQLHHDIPDSQTALFKAVAPIIERSIPFAVVFGNHDSEGSHALSRAAQMSILQNLPLSLCDAGPEYVDGIGNFSCEVLAREPPGNSLATLYFLDSHGGISSEIKEPDYDFIKPSQIKWFTEISQTLQKERKDSKTNNQFHLSLAFQHIPLPEFGDHRLSIHTGHRREPTEGPSANSRFYDTLVKERISVLACGHDHVNDFCALLPSQMQQNGDAAPQTGPWLCYGGASGFGGYCSYNKKRYHRRSRVFELDTKGRSLRTGMQVEYSTDKVEELVLVENGVIPY